MSGRRKPPGSGISRRKQARIFIRSDYAHARLKLLARDGRRKVEIIEDALDRLAEKERSLCADA
jgi:hypothetical protein